MNQVVVPEGSPLAEHDWWRQAVIYQIYPRSFADGNGDGVGDLAGLLQRVDHIDRLGIDAVWLSPIFRSPMADFGYDVADYCEVDPIFGTNDELDDLIATLHERGIRLLLDWVPNHTSDQHPWFVESRSSRDNAKRNWYVWRDRKPDGSPPTNWGAVFSSDPAWTHDPTTDQSYLHMFLAEQPDLNWSNPEVEEAMHDTLRFWLDRGVDGFRADVVHLIGKGDDIDDLPGDMRSPIIDIDTADGHARLRRIRGVLDSYDHNPMMVGEVFLFGPGQAASYLGELDSDRAELHLSFDFRPTHMSWTAESVHAAIDETQREFDHPLWPTWVLSNHDNPRHRSRYGSDESARAAAVVSLTVRGTPFLYAGEELGLTDAEIPEERVVDPGGRDGCRAPIPWGTDGDLQSGRGWGEAPWLPFPANAAGRDVASQTTDDDSMLALYQELLRIRRDSEALRVGTMELAALDGSVLRYRRRAGDESATVVVNLGDEPVPWPEDLGEATVRSLPGTAQLLRAHEAILVDN